MMSAAVIAGAVPDGESTIRPCSSPWLVGSPILPDAGMVRGENPRRACKCLMKHPHLEPFCRHCGGSR